MAMSTSQQLLSTLQAELKSASELKSILESEKQALTNGDVAVITELTTQKAPLVMQLEKLGRQRGIILKASGFPADKQGLEAFIANQPQQEAEALLTVSDELKIVANSCRNRNQVNGGIVNVNRQFLNRALSILRGRDPQVTAYGPGGEYSSSVVRQPLLGRV